jgi:alpha-tubulin suppressor-like RCC1 family protein
VLGQGHCEPRNIPELVSIPENINIQRVSSGWDHSLALCTDGVLFSWGAGQHGKLGHGNEDSLSIPCIITALEGIVVREVSAGCEHSVCVTAEGEVFVWGLADGGRLGLSNSTAVMSPIKLTVLQDMNLRYG